MAAKSPVTCHILDTQFGTPAVNVRVTLSVIKGNSPGTTTTVLAEGYTSQDGRIMTFLAPETRLEPSIYKMVFDTQAYFDASQRETFFPTIEILFEIKDPTQHYHIPLLLSPFSYTTYRGS